MPRGSRVYSRAWRNAWYQPHLVRGNQCATLCDAGEGQLPAGMVKPVRSRQESHVAARSVKPMSVRILWLLAEPGVPVGL